MCIHIIMRHLCRGLTLAACLTLSGCESLGYYYQALEGQLDLMSRRQSIEKMLAQPDTPAALKEKLALVMDVRRFAENTLHLPVADHYSRYADLERPYAVWNVFAAPEFSITPQTWCYPIAGCVAYKGFFSQAKAQAHANLLQNQGMDVYVGGVAAYSTLGWFEDPVLNTFVKRPPSSLASLLIHELAHQQLYVQGDSAFNESFATAVEILGLNLWLEQQGMAEQRDVIAQHRKRRDEFVAMILTHREKLDTLYGSSKPETAKRTGKARLTEQLREDYERLKRSWGDYDGYDRWFEGPLNNAQLSTIATYHQWVGSFVALFAANNRNWHQFYAACAELAKQNKALRDQTLGELSLDASQFRLYSSGD